MKQNISYKELKNKGFTLVEIVVIIAIMIVLLAILTPSILRYVENSRMQKDDSAMDEVCHGVLLALSDSEIFDEAVSYSIPNNYVTYTDSSGVYGAKYVDEEFWAPDGSGNAVTITFNPDENGTYVLANGLVNDMTYGNGSVADTRVADGVKQCYFSEMGQQKLYHKVEQTIGSTFSEKSATYKNSSYTVFITFDVVNGIKRADVYGEWNGTNLDENCPASLGSGTSSYTEEEEPEQTKTGGTTQSNYTSSDLQGGGGTSGNTPSYKNYLPCGHLYGTEGDHSELGCKHYACENCGCVPADCGIEGHYTGDGLDHSRNNSRHYVDGVYHNYKCQCNEWIVPEGGLYKVYNSTVTYSGGDKMPCTYSPKEYDSFYLGDYAYNYSYGYPTASGSYGGWNVGLNTSVVDRNRTTYGEILSSICKKDVCVMYYTFENCVSLTNVPQIPNTITRLQDTFENCDSLVEMPPIPSSVRIMGGTFRSCSNLKTAYIPKNMGYDCGAVFSGCSALESITLDATFSAVPNAFFSGCNALTDINYLGTMEQWSHLKYDSYWGRIGTNVVKCIDGTRCFQCSGGTATCLQRAVCKTCNKEYGELVGHTGGTATCQNKAVCTACNHEYGELGTHIIQNGACTLCGQAGVSIETTHNYASSQNYVVLGSWNYPSAKSVTISVEYETESASYDWVSIVEGNDYIAGSSYNQTKNYLNTSGNIIATTGTNSSVKFGGNSRTTRTFTDINMLQGTVIFRSDGSVQKWGAKVTITPNY